MNTYAKYCPNVFLAKCPERHEKGETITVETKHGKPHECIVFNFILEKGGYFYYSIVRADGFNVQEYARRKAERLEGFQENAEARSNRYWEASNEGADFLRLAEPIKIGHHSEKKHRALIERNHRRMDRAMQELRKAEGYEERAQYWKNRTEVINLSMPESIEYYEYELQKALLQHEGLKEGSIPRDHGYSLPYAQKAVNEAKKKLETAQKLWGE